jgi:hypothetical protein
VNLKILAAAYIGGVLAICLIAVAAQLYAAEVGNGTYIALFGVAGTAFILGWMSR